MPSNHRKLDFCLNCGEEFHKQERFCPTCGQENKDLKMPLHVFLGDFFS